MATIKVHNKLHQLALEFLADSRNSRKKLGTILSALEGNDASLQSGILASELVFSELLRRGEMRDDVIPAGTNGMDAYTYEMQTSYANLWGHLVSILNQRPVRVNVASQALSTSMKLISLEGRHPLEASKKDEYYFPSQRLKLLLTALISSKRNNSPLLALFQEYSSYPDVLYNVWKQLFHVAMGPQPLGQRPNETFIRNFLDLIDKFPLPKATRDNRYGPEFHEPLCANKDRPGYTESSYVLNMDQLGKCVDKVWGCVVHWDHTPASHRALLVVLLERMLPFLDKPLLLTDYLMDSLDIGGPISLLALQGLFVLIQNHNLEYPYIFGKLYSLFEPEIFHTKCKARLCYLSNQFLSSTHLPGSIAAAFAKRLARLCLVTAPEDTHILIQFIGNLLLRHPMLKKLTNRPLQGSTRVRFDPLNEHAGMYELEENLPRGKKIEEWGKQYKYFKRALAPSRLENFVIVCTPEPLSVSYRKFVNLCKRASEDPFVMEERDPSKSGAMESSLWELQSLQRHALPGVATAANFINNPFPSVEWDMNRILEETSDDLFERELKKKAKEISLALERSYLGSFNQQQYVSPFWQLR